MRRSTLHRLTTRFVALLAIVVMGGVQPMLSACTCGFTIPQSFAEEAVELETCCSGCCATESTDESSDAACCGSSGADSNCDDSNCDDCHCCVSAEETPLPAATPSLQTHDDSTAFVALFPAALPVHTGLNGVAWHNAFDLASPGGPAGIRLHALLSVWRN